MTGAVVLVGVAVSAVTGCVTVRGKPEPHRSPDAGPSRMEEAPEQASGGAEPRMGGPSLREGVSRPVPERSGRVSDGSGAGGSAPGAGGAPRAGEEGRAEQGPPPAAAGDPGQAAAPRGAGDVPGPRKGAAPAGDVPELPGDAGVCDLGRRYGGWAADSSPQQACENAYGH